MREKETPLHILIVEDNPGDYFLITEYLEENFREASISHADTFKEAEVFLKNNSLTFDVVLLDLSLSDKHGEALINEVLTLAEEIPVIVLTGYADIEFSIRSLSLGVSDYLIKDDLNANALYKSILYSIERKEAHTKLEKTQKLYKDLFELNPFPVWIFDEKTLRFMEVNAAAVSHYGYSEEEFLKMTLEDIRPEGDIPVLKNVLKLIEEGDGEIPKGVYRHKKKNGELINVEIYGYPIIYKERPARTIIIYDVTTQKLYEENIIAMNTKLRNLSAHLQQVREEERIRISREIHDELGQQLTGIKLDASWLKGKAQLYFPEGEDRMLRLISSINTAINTVRKIATNLRPSVLDDLGLEAALEWHLNKFKLQTGIVTTLQADSLSRKYSPEVVTTLYRIFQEATTNVMRHSGATEITVNLYEKNSNLVLEVLDNGKGIEAINTDISVSLGITGMKERALTINAEFSLKKREEGGTTLKVTVPL